MINIDKYIKYIVHIDIGDRIIKNKIKQPCSSIKTILGQYFQCWIELFLNFFLNFFNIVREYFAIQLTIFPTQIQYFSNIGV